MIVSSTKYIVQEHSKSMYETKMSVTVKKFEKEDVGSYRCIAKNSLGEVDSSIRLYGRDWVTFVDIMSRLFEIKCRIKEATFLSIFFFLLFNVLPEIPGPERKIPKYGSSDTNEVVKVHSKTQPHGKDSHHHQPHKITYQPEDDYNGSTEDFDDADGNIGNSGDLDDVNYPNNFLSPTRSALDFTKTNLVPIIGKPIFVPGVRGLDSEASLISAGKCNAIHFALIMLVIMSLCAHFT